MKSFFDKLTGAVNREDEIDNFIDTREKILNEERRSGTSSWEEEERDGELSVDVYEDGDKNIFSL